MSICTVARCTGMRQILRLYWTHIQYRRYRYLPDIPPPPCVEVSPWSTASWPPPPLPSSLEWRQPQVPVPNLPTGLRIRPIFRRFRIQQIRMLKTGSGSFWHLPRINSNILIFFHINRIFSDIRMLTFHSQSTPQIFTKGPDPQPDPKRL